MNSALARHAPRMVLLGPILLLQAGWLTLPLPAGVRALHLFVLAAALWRPAAGLMVVAALAPLAGTISLLAGSPYPAPKLLEQLALAGMTGAVLRIGAPIPTRVGFPAALLAAVAIASAAVTLVPTLAAAAPGASAGSLAHAFWRAGYFEMWAEWEPASLALLMAEGALLAWLVERHVRRSPEAAVRILRASLAGAAAASLAAILRILLAAGRSSSFAETLAASLASVRVSVLGDVNAAASMLLLPLVGGVGLVAASRRKPLPAVTVAVVAVGLWLTGSRVALASVASVGLVEGFRLLRREPGRARLAAGAAVAAITVAAIAGVTLYPAARNMDVSRSVEARLTLARAGVTMFAAAPVWGVGLGRFDDRSAELVGSEISRLLGQSADGRLYDRENAHNNFLQVLAEQGLVGLAALLLLLGSVGIAALRAERRGTDPVRRWTVYALAACLLTWLTGHPLLVPEFVFVFFLFVGLLGGMGQDNSRARATHSKGRWSSDSGVWRSANAPLAKALLVAAVLATIPFRATAALRDADLEHLGAGLSVWQHDDALPYRRAGKTFAVYVPATEAATVPVRREPGAPDPVLLEVRRDGRLIASRHVGGDGWTVLRLPYRGEARRFVLLEFTVANAPAAAPSDAPLLRVGRPVR